MNFPNVCTVISCVLWTTLPVTNSVMVHYANAIPGSFPPLSDEVLEAALQEDHDDDERAVWLNGVESPRPHSGPRPRQSNPDSCHRPCQESGVGEPKICYFRWRIEAHFTMGRPCGDCHRNVTDCTLPQCVTADGYERGILTVNRKLPGPSIHVCQGDIIVVDVKNMMPGRTTTLHWHGIRQRDSPHMDGVPMVTQCPIPENSIFRYRFVADEVGTHLWHSHDGFQKMDGIVGALVVREPQHQDPVGHLYDLDLRSHTLVITDWFHLDADQRFPGLLRRENGQLPDTYLINGRGSFRMSVDSETPYTVIRVSRYRRYRLRIIGATCTSCAFSLNIEGHRMLVVAADITPVHPVLVDSINVLPGERYDVVVAADQPPAAYWIHVRAVGACSLIGANQVAVLRYKEAGLTMPSSPHPGAVGLPQGVTLNKENSVCEMSESPDVCVTHLQSLLPTPPSVLDRDPDYRLPVEFGFYFYTPEQLYQTGTYHRYFNPPSLFPPSVGKVNNISNTLGPSPLLSQFEDIPSHLFCKDEYLRTCKSSGLCECLNLVKIPLGATVEFVIADSGRVYGGLSHPFHIHGYYFYVLAQGLFKQGQSLSDVIDLLDQGQISFSAKPVLKDTVAVPAGGFVVVRIIADNPGFWIFHCHFLYHLSTGMSLIYQVGEFEDMVPTPRRFTTCGDFF